MWLRRLSQVVGWLAAAYIAFVTLSPVHYRPQLGHPNLERLAAYLFIGATFSFGYPRARQVAAIAVVAGAFLLETGQLFVPGRDAHVSDALVKALGGLVGVLLAAAGDKLLHSVHNSLTAEGSLPRADAIRLPSEGL